MTEKAGLEWKLRGYPVKVSHRLEYSKIHQAIDWCNDNLLHGTYVWAGTGTVVFTDEETAAFFKLTWAYD
jgi:hypothetical protein